MANLTDKKAAHTDHYTDMFTVLHIYTAGAKLRAGSLILHSLSHSTMSLDMNVTTLQLLSEAGQILHQQGTCWHQPPWLPFAAKSKSTNKVVVAHNLVQGLGTMSSTRRLQQYTRKGQQIH